MPAKKDSISKLWVMSDEEFNDRIQEVNKSFSRMTLTGGETVGKNGPLKDVTNDLRTSKHALSLSPQTKCHNVAAKLCKTGKEQRKSPKGRSTLRKGDLRESIDPKPTTTAGQQPSEPASDLDALKSRPGATYSSAKAAQGMTTCLDAHYESDSDWEDVDYLTQSDTIVGPSINGTGKVEQLITNQVVKGNSQKRTWLATVFRGW